MLKRLIQRLRWVFAIVLLATPIVLIALWWRTQLEVTEAGAHRRLIVPLIGEQAISIPFYTGTSDSFVMPHLDGPVVRPLPDHEWDARWFCNDRVYRQKLSNTESVLSIGCEDKIKFFYFAQAAARPNVDEMASKVVVLSDLEGNHDFLVSALKELKVTDDNGDWILGDGQLVILGDSVDRGKDVFAVLWTLHSLAAVAETHGGSVRFVLGNHEQYILRGNFSRAHPEHMFAVNQLGGFEAAFANDTVIGAWLRQQPVALKLGDVLFVHGGISNDIVENKLSIDDLNQAMLDYWQQPKPVSPSPKFDAVLGSKGVTQYRGYIQPVEDLYPAASTADVNQALAFYQAKQIVVAHTIVDKIRFLHSNKVIAVNVNSDDSTSQALVFDNGIPKVVTLNTKRHIQASDPSYYRRLDLTASKDYRIFMLNYEKMKYLSSIPHPY
jgi:hypothetical protein